MTSARTRKASADAARKSSAVDKVVLATINAPYQRNIDAKTLATCLARAEPGDWPVHVATFFTDVSPELVFAFAELHGISRSALARAYSATKRKTGEASPVLEAELVSLAPSA